jgi:glycosyltransferase involved in cell wall biosynthesis
MQLSFIIPALARNHELDRCIAAIQSAITSHELYEIIVICPPDSVMDIEAGFPMARVVIETRKSIYGAMNDGIRAAKGEFLLKDDVTVFDVFWGNKGVYRNFPNRYLLLIRNLCHQGVVYRKSLFYSHGVFCTRFRVQADHFMNIKLFWSKPEAPSISYRKQVFSHYSANGFSTTEKDRVFHELYPLILRNYVGRLAASLLIARRFLMRRLKF